MRNDGEIVGSKVYRGENAVENFFESVLQEEERIRERMAEKRKAAMKPKDWKDLKNATACHVCEEGLIVEEYWDSVPVLKRGKRGKNISVKATKSVFGKVRKKEKKRGRWHTK